MSTPNFPISPFYTAISLGYVNGSFVADRLFPRVPVGSREFKYFAFTAGQRYDFPPTLLSRKGEPNEVEFTGTWTPAFVDDHGLQDIVPQYDIDAARGTPVDPMGVATEGLTELIGLAREKRVADMITTAASYPAANKITLSGNDQWSAVHADSDPFADVTTGLAAINGGGNGVVGVTSEAVWNKLRVHPLIVGALAPTVPAANQRSTPMSTGAVSELFGIDEIIVVKTKINTAAYGQAQVLSNMYGKFFALLANRTGASLRGTQSTFGLTGEWGNRVTRTVFDPLKGLRGSQRVIVGESVKETVIDYTAGYLISAAIA